MKTYKIYFEIFGKKMKYEVEAESKNDAINKLKNNINIIKIDEGINGGINEGINDDDVLENLKNMFGMK
jgi:fructose-bisphosphate aldolase class 1